MTPMRSERGNYSRGDRNPGLRNRAVAVQALWRGGRRDLRPMLELLGGTTRLTSRRETMLTKDEAYQFAEHWVAAWNAHDLDRIMSHYEAEVELISPVAAQLVNAPEGA